MVIHLLPEQIFGYDTDDLLAYQTPKQALVRDRYVGALFYILTGIAMSWVLIGQVLWRNEHFMLKDVKGIPRMKIDHPTVNQCDPNEADCLASFKSLSELPYCNQHAGGPSVAHPGNCTYADKHSMFIDGTVGQQVFIPTSVVTLEEVKRCEPNATNDHSCDNEYEKDWGDRGYYFNETQMQFYADIEDFVIQFTSTYHRENIAGTSLDHPGFYSECFDKDESAGKDLSWKERLTRREKVCKDERRMPVECIPGVDCHKGRLQTIKDIRLAKKLTSNHGMDNEDDEDDDTASPDGTDGTDEGSLVQLHGLSTSRRLLRANHGRHASVHTRRKYMKPKEDRPTPDVYANTWGDSFKLGKLMQLAGVDLDRHYNMDAFTTRMAGTIIEVEATYTNLRRFLSSLGLSQVQYTYRVRERKLPYLSKESLHPDQPEDFPQRRRYLVQHGILLNFQVGGEFGFFNIVYLLITLTTSLALLATAFKITDLTSLYLHPRRKNYFHMKYDVSGDFSDMWLCTKCGYLNLSSDATCMGLEKWESHIDTPPCGACKPDGWISPRSREEPENDKRQSDGNQGRASRPSALSESALSSGVFY